MIVDLSFPHGASINDGIAPSLCSLSYASEVVHIILQLGQGTWLININLKNTYRVVPVHPDDHHLLATS